jgi:hypothetical protein
MLVPGAQPLGSVFARFAKEHPKVASMVVGRYMGARESLGIYFCFFLFRARCKICELTELTFMIYLPS